MISRERGNHASKPVKERKTKEILIGCNRAGSSMTSTTRGKKRRKKRIRTVKFRMKAKNQHEIFIPEQKEKTKGKNNNKGDTLQVILNIMLNLYHHTSWLRTFILRHQHIKLRILPQKPELGFCTPATVSTSLLLKS